MRDRLSRYFDYATLSLERWPLKAIDFDIATDGLTATYRRARQLLLRNRLGSCQDLAVLTELTAPHQLLAPWRSRLAPLIVARRGAHLKTAQRLAGRLFAEKPKAFRRRIAALWSAGQ